MNVKDFVRESLQQIVEGVQEAQTSVAETGAMINPSLDMTSVPNTQSVKAGGAGEGRLFDSGRRQAPIESVSFDIAVTVEEGSRSEDTASGRAAIRVLGMGFGVGASTSDADESRRSSVSRLKFNVLVKLPSGGSV